MTGPKGAVQHSYVTHCAVRMAREVGLVRMTLLRKQYTL